MEEEKKRKKNEKENIKKNGDYLINQLKLQHF